MPEKNVIFREIGKFLQIQNIMNISGEAGTGKTTLAVYLVGHYLTQKPPFHSQCMWIQASEFFPNRRLTQLFEKQKNKLRFLKTNIFITPLKHPFLSYQEQSQFLTTFHRRHLPPELKLIVIDNVSHHLRHTVSNYSHISDKVRLLNQFYEQQLLPLIMFSQQHKIILILIHEVSYDPTLDRVIPFFNKLYKRIECINLFLAKKNEELQKILTLSYIDDCSKIPYIIRNDGFDWINAHG
jgi:RecA/RadA recombinase